MPIDDPMAILVEIGMGTNPVEVSWDALIFGKDNDILLYLHRFDLLEIALDN